MNNTEQEHQAFEAAYAREWPMSSTLPGKFDRDEQNDYVDGTVHVGWNMWQAARATKLPYAQAQAQAQALNVMDATDPETPGLLRHIASRLSITNDDEIARVMNLAAAHIETLLAWPAAETGYGDGDAFGEAIIPEGWQASPHHDRRVELVRAVAMGLAEIERIDRAAASTPPTAGHFTPSASGL